MMLAVDELSTGHATCPGQKEREARARPRPGAVFLSSELHLWTHAYRKNDRRDMRVSAEWPVTYEYGRVSRRPDPRPEVPVFRTLVGFSKTLDRLNA